MKEALLQNIQDIERECKIIENVLANTNIPNELMPFKNWVSNFIQNIQQDNDRNRYLLGLGRPIQTKAAYYNTEQNANNLRVLASQYAHIVQRYHQNDYLGVVFLAWLHNQHSQSREKSFALSNGNFAIYPDVNHPMIYYMPVSSQLNLLHFPLFFHEFGHFLYAAHKQEVEVLIKEFQSKISDKIAIVNEENTEKNEKKRDKNNAIIETWFSWMQEFFCDAVGLYIGGKSYLHIFSLYLRLSGNSSFYANEENLKLSTHPVSWLRIKFLVQRAKTLGLEKEANDLQKLWREMAQILNIKEKYHGYFDEDFLSDAQQCLDDMIEETQPICFKDYLQNTDKQWESMNFIELVNWAWEKYLENAEVYNLIEQKVVEHYVE